MGSDMTAALLQLLTNAATAAVAVAASALLAPTRILIYRKR